jgi:hypothetical protein
MIPIVTFWLVILYVGAAIGFACSLDSPLMGGAVAGLKRVRHFLRLNGHHDRLTHVVCEARGAKEDADLELAFQRVCDGDNRTNAKYNFDIVICDKKANSEGLQLADLMARPIGLHILRPDQPNGAYEVLSAKFFSPRYRHDWARIEGVSLEKRKAPRMDEPALAPRQAG